MPSSKVTSARASLPGERNGSPDRSAAQKVLRLRAKMPCGDRRRDRRQRDRRIARLIDLDARLAGVGEQHGRVRMHPAALEIDLGVFVPAVEFRLPALQADARSPEIEQHDSGHAVLVEVGRGDREFGVRRVEHEAREIDVVGVLLEVADVARHLVLGQPIRREFVVRLGRHRLVGRDDREPVAPGGPIAAEAVSAQIEQPSLVARLPPVAHRVAHQQIGGIVALHVADHQPAAAFFRRLQDRLGLAHGDRHRLLHEDVLAGAQQIGGDIALHDIVGRNRDGFDVGVVAQRDVRVDKFWNAIMVGDRAAKLRPQLRERNKFALRNGRKIRQVNMLGDEAAADIRQLDRFLRGSVRHDYPFKAPPANPAMNCRCIRR